MTNTADTLPQASILIIEVISKLIIGDIRTITNISKSAIKNQKWNWIRFNGDIPKELHKHISKNVEKTTGYHVKWLANNEVIVSLCQPNISERRRKNKKRRRRK